jgi:hypothetical protein
MMKLLLYIYTIVLKNDQLAANPVPRAAPTIAGLIPAVHQHHLRQLVMGRTSRFVNRSSDCTCTHTVEDIVFTPIPI